MKVVNRSFFVHVVLGNCFYMKAIIIRLFFYKSLAIMNQNILLSIREDTIMIITTTMNIENKPVQEYKGIVFGEVVEGRNFVKDFMSGIRDIVGGRSGSYEDSLMNARQAAIDEMAKRASKIGANAVIGVSFQYSTVGAQNGMLMVTCNGTAVVI